MRPILQLLAIASGLSWEGSVGQGDFEALAGEALSYPLDDYRERATTLNDDGLPLQLCVSLGNVTKGLQVLVEPGPLFSPLATKLQASIQLVTRHLERRGMIRCIEKFNRLCSEVFPRCPSDLTSWRSALWIALRITESQALLKIYCNLKWGTQRERWVRAGRALAIAGCDLQELSAHCDLAATLGTRLHPEAVMVTPDSAGFNECKVYWRAEEVSQHNLVGLLKAISGDFSTDALAKFHRALFPDVTHWPRNSLVISREISTSPGGPAGAKVDFYCGITGCSDVEYSERVISLCDSFKYNPDKYRAILNIIKTEQSPTNSTARAIHQFVGIGFSSSGHVRINVYLNPFPLGAGICV